MKIMRHSRRNKLTTEDLNSALRLRNVEVSVWNSKLQMLYRSYSKEKNINIKLTCLLVWMLNVGPLWLFFTWSTSFCPCCRTKGPLLYWRQWNWLERIGSKHIHHQPCNSNFILQTSQSSKTNFLYTSLVSSRRCSATYPTKPKLHFGYDKTKDNFIRAVMTTCQSFHLFDTCVCLVVQRSLTERNEKLMESVQMNLWQLGLTLRATLYVDVPSWSLLTRLSQYSLLFTHHFGREPLLRWNPLWNTFWAKNNNSSTKKSQNWFFQRPPSFQHRKFKKLLQNHPPFQSLKYYNPLDHKQHRHKLHLSPMCKMYKMYKQRCRQPSPFLRHNHNLNYSPPQLQRPYRRLEQHISLLRYGQLPVLQFLKRHFVSLQANPDCNNFFPTSLNSFLKRWISCSLLQHWNWCRLRLCVCVCVCVSVCLCVCVGAYSFTNFTKSPLKLLFVSHWIPFFCYCTEKVSKNLKHLPILKALMQFVRALLNNPHLHIEPYVCTHSHNVADKRICRSKCAIIIIVTFFLSWIEWTFSCLLAPSTDACDIDLSGRKTTVWRSFW